MRKHIFTDGQLISNRYTITEYLNEGGWAEVYRVKDNNLEREVALKALWGPFEDSEKERFQREALIIAQLESEHIVRIYDYAETEDDIPFITMEFLEGQNLQHTIDKRPMRVFTEHETIEIIKQILRGLSVVHKKEIIHRDIKPSNIFVVTV